MSDAPKDDSADDARAVWDVFSSFHAILHRERPYSLMSDELRATVAVQLTVAYETRRARLATDELLSKLLEGQTP